MSKPFFTAESIKNFHVYHVYGKDCDTAKSQKAGDTIWWLRAEPEMLEVLNGLVAPLLEENEALKKLLHAANDEWAAAEKQLLATIKARHEDHDRETEKVGKLTEQNLELKEALRKAVLFAECVIGKQPNEINYRTLNEVREALAAAERLENKESQNATKKLEGE